MANSTQVAFCIDCYQKLTTANHAKLSQVERDFLASERTAWATGKYMKFAPGKCSKCGEDKEVIYH
ncbi:MAG: hypothetical protein ACREI2_03560 [Nitrospiraceae bacterium]